MRKLSSLVTRVDERYNNMDMPTYEVSVDYGFTATHALPLPSGGLEESHTHDWRVTAMFRSPQLRQDTGVVVDFLDVRQALTAVCNELDGKDLNALPAFDGGNVSAEHVAEYIATVLADRDGYEGILYCVQVTEATGCRAAYYP